ncbi:MAG: HNH endonuclease [Deltaproteobacteria bacterium]|nr:HNH endonuclease [Deltaproteobacteria bacterium]
MIEGSTLVLNRSYVPVHVTSIKRAICLVFKGLAKIVDQQYQVYDFKSWSELSVSKNDEQVSMTEKVIRVPRVIMLQCYNKVPRRNVRFSRENIYLRDNNTCQYCGHAFKRQNINIDHVIPLSQGGETDWTNVVCSCIACNSKKGGRTPQQAGMTLLRRPAVPQYSLFMEISPKDRLYDLWHVYMNPVDFAYWNLDLKK